MSKTTRFRGGALPEAGDGQPGRGRLPRDIKVMLVAAFLIAIGFGLVAPVLPQFATTFDVGATAAAVIDRRPGRHHRFHHLADVPVVLNGLSTCKNFLLTHQQVELKTNSAHAETREG